MEIWYFQHKYEHISGPMQSEAPVVVKVGTDYLEVIKITKYKGRLIIHTGETFKEEED